MKRFIWLLILFITTITFTSCNVNTFERKKNNLFYLDEFKTYKNGLFNHFPEKKPAGFILSYYNSNVKLVDSCFGPINYVLASGYYQAKYDSLKNHFNTLAKESFYPNDTSVLLVFPYCDVSVSLDGYVVRNLETKKKKELARHNRTIQNAIPIPMFEINEFQASTFSGLPDDFKIYVLDAQSGKYMGYKYLQDCVCLPKKWKHGFSKGVALSDKRKVIIYWVTVW